jgi:4,5-dihydroxyphthalate decarboxylase
MSKLQLSVAIGDYDRMRPLVDGLVGIDGVDPQFMLLEPEEIFFRAFRHADFDICELSLSSYSVKTAAGTSPYIAVPVFPSRAFRHTSIYVRADRIKSRPTSKAAASACRNISSRLGPHDPRGRLRNPSGRCHVGPRRL